MAVTPNPRDQEIQSVLYSMNYNVGSRGVDGMAGRDTNTAMKQYASDRGLDGNDLKAVGDAILANMKDPAFRQKMLENLAAKPQNSSTIRATQWVMERSYQNVPGMQDPVTRLMTGKDSQALRTAVAETDRGVPSDRVLSSYGLPDGLIRMAKAELTERSGSATNVAFRESASDMTAAAPAARDASPKSGPKANVAQLNLTQP